jgi:hypothetical protein
MLSMLARTPAKCNNVSETPECSTVRYYEHPMFHVVFPLLAKGKKPKDN